MSRDAARDAVVRELAAAPHLLLVSHTHPDGDAIGSVVGMREVLVQLGKRVEVFISEHDRRLPDEIDLFPLGTVVDERDVALDGRLVVFLDCGNADRSPLSARIPEMTGPVLNIDHHHDNTRFGTINFVDPAASATAELVWELADELGARLTPEIAEPLYVGLVTDTGRFGYENTTARSHQMAADLVEAGVDVSRMRRRLYEDMPLPKLRLLERALGSVQTYGQGALIAARLTEADFAAASASEKETEGIIDLLRGVRGVRVAALARELELSPGSFKVSLRAIDAAIDVSAIARAAGGGGHRQAAGFTTAHGADALAQFILEQVAVQDGHRQPA